LTPGLTEKAIAQRCVDVLAAEDIQAIVTLVAADERLQKYRHPLPTDLAWKKALMIVICARRQGLIASLTRIVTTGPVPDELRKRTLATAKVNARLFAATLEGATGAELYAVAAESYAAVGFAGEEKLHHQGGACGYRTREWVAHPTCSETVKDRQAFAWNPSITGTKVEETVILRNREHETITRSTDWPQIEVEVGKRTYSSPDVLAL
jgi:antitoxin VapB